MREKFSIDIPSQSDDADTRLLGDSNSNIPTNVRTSGIMVSVFNLAKCLIGAGVLGLPGSIAYFSDMPNALFPASIITISLALFAIYTYSTIGKFCELTQSSTFQEVWNHSVGKKWEWIIFVTIAGKCFFSIFAYSIAIGDLLQSVNESFDLPEILTNRYAIIISITVFILYPLCSLKTLNSLAPFSILGLCGTIYTAIFMTIRYVDGTYSPDGIFYEILPLSNKPLFYTRQSVLDAKIFVFIGSLGTAFVSHYTAPRFLNELKHPTMNRFNTIVIIGYLLTTLIYVYIMSIGFLTFGGNSQGFILNNYSVQDNLAKFSRVAITLSLLTGYPFLFAAMRESIIDTLHIPTVEQQISYRKFLTISLLLIVMIGSLVFRDIGFILSITGALFGCTLMFILPPIIYLANVKKFYKDDFMKKRIETIFNYVLIVLGFIMIVLGVVANLLKS